MILWSVHSCLYWCKNYKHRSRNARIIVENKWFLFYGIPCIYFPSCGNPTHYVPHPWGLLCNTTEILRKNFHAGLHCRYDRQQCSKHFIIWWMSKTKQPCKQLPLKNSQRDEILPCRWQSAHRSETTRRRSRVSCGQGTVSPTDTSSDSRSLTGCRPPRTPTDHGDGRSHHPADNEHHIFANNTYIY